MAEANQRVDARHTEKSAPSLGCRSMQGQKVTVLKFLVFLLPVLIGVVIVRSGRISHVLVSRDTGPPPSSPACANPPLDNCSFYANCLESRYHCGPSGYPIGYGQKYCEKFSGNRSLLDAQGQQWMINTMHCLQTALVSDAIATATTSCQTLEDQAFGAHPRCYIDSGLCALGLHDWSAIFEIVDITTVFENWDAFKATVETAVDCAEFYAYMIIKGLF